MAFIIARWFYSLVFFILLFVVPGACVSFTLRPDDPSYVEVGSTAYLMWDYKPVNQQPNIVFSVAVNGVYTTMLARQDGVLQYSNITPSAYQGRVKLKERATLVVENITSQDNNASFKCELIGTGSSIVQLILLEQPNITHLSLPSTYVEGSSVTISCTASGNPPPDVTWIRNGAEKSSGKKAAFLIIDTLRRADDGLYTCRANNSVKIVAQNTTLVVHYKPVGTKLTASIPSNSIIQGGEVTFTCSVAAAKPLVSEYTFFLNDSEITASPKGNYTIGNVSRSLHHGIYKCVPRNFVGNGSEDSFVLNVKVPVQFTVLPHNVTENLTNSFTLSCDASGFPAPSITWRKFDGEVFHKKYLKIERCSKSDAGEYICTASNGVGPKKTVKAYVTVQYPPTIQEVTQSTEKSWTGQTVTLKCVSDGIPTPTLTWYEPDGNEKQSIRARENKVRVTLMGDQDFGYYNCNAANGLIPAHDRIIKITQIKTPGIPSIVVETQASSLTVRWTAPADDGGSPITAHRLIILKGDTEINIVNITDPGTTSYTFVNLERDTDYTVKVLSRNFVFEGNAVVKVVKTAFKGPPATVEIEDLPTEVTESTITLRWRKPRNNGKEITKYTVYQRIIKDANHANWTKLQTIMDVSVTQVEVKLDKGKVYEFAVTATNELGESVLQEEMAKKVKRVEKPTGRDGSQTGGGDDGMNIAIYAGAAAAVVLLIIGIIVIIVLWKRRKPSIHEEVSVDRVESANHYEADDGYQEVSRAEAAQSLQASGSETEASYALVDMTKKKKNKQPPSDEYAQVDMSQKTKKKHKGQESPQENQHTRFTNVGGDFMLNDERSPPLQSQSSGNPTSEQILVSSEYMPLNQATKSPIWEIRREQVHIMEMIGKGAFSQVAKAVAFLNINGTEGQIIVAVKMLKENAPESDRKDLLSELELMKKLKPHPHVIKLMGCITNSDPLLVLIEHIPYGDLLGYLRRSRGLIDTYFKDPDVKPETNLTSEQLVRFAWQIADGMKYLSSKKIIHRDLAARNVLVGEGEGCKVTDFGMARNVGQDDIYTRRRGVRKVLKTYEIERAQAILIRSLNSQYFSFLLTEIGRI
ncbi:neural cell adhesion molecule 1-like [Stylophora pistillata]|uniref:neural cell adhesion molecule 1-like n=1 Tax=Stylophora pistillata TaxID=50429 RepID=UPI000C03BD52|nr:neural cell adhesion molecule 1-like [Stylophora pistillata]